MIDVLATIVAGARKSAEERARLRPLEDLRRAAETKRPRGDAFRAALAEPGIRVIAECKRRSPSKGVLRGGYDPAAIAARYADAGAAGISVLTEPSFFDGDMAHLEAVRAAVDVPVLRKDFIVTEYQVVEARAIGADAVLLIAAALDRAALAHLLAAARREGLMALVETHTADEVRVAADAGADVIGVNCRNLKTLDVDTSLFDALADAVPDEAIAVAESGLRSGADAIRLNGMGYDAFLVGERFMTAPDHGAALAAFLRDAGAQR